VYQNLKDMRELLAAMLADLAAASGSAPHYRLAETSKGLG
jgi:hypothetical protein